MDCKICNNERMIGGKRCECVRVLNTLHFSTWSEINMKKHFKLLSDLENRKIFFEFERDGKKQTPVVNLKEELEMYIEDSAQNIKDNVKLLFKGTNGRGKTQAAVTLALEILKNMNLETKEIDLKRFYFFNAMDLINENKLFDEKRKEEIIRKINLSDVLILDELGEELELGTHDKRKQEILRLLKYIAENFDGLLIVTTNLENAEDTYKKENPRLYSRIFTSGTMFKYNFLGKGEDERSKKQATNKNKYLNRF